MLTFFDRRLHRLHWQLTLIFLAGFLGIGIAIGLPVMVLISRQASSRAQLLLEQSRIASRAFIEGEHADLQSLALLISQRPTLTQLLREQDRSALSSYLDTLRTSADLDLILICQEGEEIVGVNQNGGGTALCQHRSRCKTDPGTTRLPYRRALLYPRRPGDRSRAEAERGDARRRGRDDLPPHHPAAADSADRDRGLPNFARALGEFGAVLVVGGGVQGRAETATLFIYRALDERQYIGAYSASLALGLFSLLLVLGSDWLRSRKK